MNKKHRAAFISMTQAQAAICLAFNNYVYTYNSWKTQFNKQVPLVC